MKSLFSRPLLRYMVKDVRLQAGLYIALALQAFVTLTLHSGFARSVIGVGLDYQRSALFRVIVESLSGVYGRVSVDLIFADGPIRFALYAGALFPILFVLTNAFSSTGNEIRSGFLRLVLYAPITETQYIRTAIVRDVILIFLIALWGAILAIYGGLANNFTLGPDIVVDLFVIAFTAIVFVLFALSVVRLFDHAVVAVSVYGMILGLFVVTHLMRLTIGAIGANRLVEGIGVVLGVVSPVFFAEVVLSAVRIHDSWMLAVGILGLCVLIGVLFVFQSAISKAHRSDR